MVRSGRRYKVVRGMASLSANVDRRTLDQGQVSDEDWKRWQENWDEIGRAHV